MSAAIYIYALTDKTDTQMTTARAMKQAGFGDKESKNRTLHKKLLCTVKRLKDNKDELDLTPLPQIIKTTNVNRSMSEISLWSSVHSKAGKENQKDPETTPLPKRKLLTTNSVAKKTRQMSKQKLVKNAQVQEAISREQNAFFAGCAKWRVESVKPQKERQSAREIVAHFNELYNANVNETTVRRKVKTNTDHILPSRGKRPGMSDKMKCCLTNAILSYIQLSCVGMEFQPNRKDMCKQLALCLEHGPVYLKHIDKLFDRLFSSIAVQVEAVTGRSTMEARRVNWSTFLNVNTWFDLLKRFLIQYNFATELTSDVVTDLNKGELFFEPDQLHRVLNLDESEISTDGSTKIRGGRPVTEYQVRGSALPNGTTKTNKSGYSATFIGGSAVWGYPIPAHFQLKSKAREENRKISTEFLEHVPSVCGYYGFGELTERGITFNLNPKGGMDAEEFAKYVMQPIVPLYPDAQDIPGKHILIIVDSGPGHENEELLSFLKVQGFYVFPGVPNTTHITQVTDKNYGPFKTIFRDNLSKLTKARMEKKKTVCPFDISLLVFGGYDCNSNVTLCSAFDEVFAVEKSIAVWKEIGNYPFTRNCLNSKDIVHKIVLSNDGTIDLTKDHVQTQLLSLKQQNIKDVAELFKLGLNGEPFMKSLPSTKGKKKLAVTAANTKERQVALAKAQSAGEQFIVTGGDALNCDNYFLGKERQQVSDRIRELRDRNQAWEAAKVVEEAALEVLETVEKSSGEDPYTETGAKHLKKDDLSKLYEWKKGKKPQQMNKGALLTAWMESEDSPKVNCNNWEDSDKEELARLEREELDVSNTALGRQRRSLLKKSLAALSTMSKEEVNAQLDNDAKEILKRMLND